ncbi:hypothetical protein GCM10010353_38920 [Streptomyces chryseus]|nr:hypothetical protein GCM10010353_38920 [Streptomyces chryseus]
MQDGADGGGGGPAEDVHRFEALAHRHGHQVTRLGARVLGGRGYGAEVLAGPVLSR